MTDPWRGLITATTLLWQRLLRQTLWDRPLSYGRDHELGSLEPGKLADIIVLDRNLFSAPKDEIKDAKVLLTVMDGNVVYRCPDSLS